MGRYDRQVPVFGQDGQERIMEARVAVAGCGGLGCNVIKDLVLAGVGSLRIIDHDTISESDLNRQFVYCGESGNKVETIGRWIRIVSPDTDVEELDLMLTDDNAYAFADGCDVIVDCLDNNASRLILNRAAVNAGVPLVHGGVESMFGQVTTVIPGATPCLCCFLGKGDAGTVPSVSAAVSVIASIQAAEVLKIITGTGTILAGRLLTVDIGNGSFDEVAIKRREDCPCCGSYIRSSL